jgi:drug/metabolite transporter (DMT)-like permease
MPSLVLALALVARVVSNPFSNVYQKWLTQAGMSPLVVIWITHGLLSLVGLPLLVLERGALAANFLALMALSSVLTVLGNLLIVEAVKRSDLSILGPINSYKAVVSLFPGFLLLGEVPGFWGLIGIALIIAGSGYLLNDGGSTRRQGLSRVLRDRGIQLRLAALAVSALEAVVMRQAMKGTPAEVTLAAWAVLGFVTSSLLMGCGRTRPERQLMGQHAGSCLMLALTTGIMQGCTILVFERMQVSYALALFQTSTIVSVLLGWRYFKERHIARRLAGSMIMIAGAALIVLSGTEK